MLANNYEWYTYGGLIGFGPGKNFASFTFGKTWTARYVQYLSGPAKQFEPGWQVEEFRKRDTEMTRYVSNGASVSVPSEDIGFYFGGLKASNSGASDELVGNANTPSTTLIEVNMASQNNETWRNVTLPANVISRVNGEIAWVPVSKKGILVVIGGVINPSFVTETRLLNAHQSAESKRVNPGFMSTVSIYDIENEAWYNQITSGEIPSQLTQGCSVVAASQDGSSYHIYWYGGYDGISETTSDAFTDDVWALSIPSFIWTKVYSSSNKKHARAAHKCVKPYPDQMIVFGGYTSPRGVSATCVEGIVQVFNLSSATWLDSYDPLKRSEYSVLASIYRKIGGSEKGGATRLEPTNGFSNSSLAAVFKTKYDSSKIIKYYPFSQTKDETIKPPPTISSDPTIPNRDTPSYLAPVLGAVFGALFIALIVLAILLVRRKKLLRKQTVAKCKTGKIKNRPWIDKWLVSRKKDIPVPNMPEIGGEQVYEVEDTSQPVELEAQTFKNIEKASDHSEERSHGLLT